MNEYANTCEVEDCNSSKEGKKDFCKMHQTRFNRHGSPHLNMRPKIKTGDIFGRLTVKETVGKDKGGNSLFLCLCECGGFTTTRSFSLRSGRSKSCGCFHQERISQKKEKKKVFQKVCSICGVLKPIADFGKRLSSVDGHKSQCNPCGRLWHKKNRDKVSESNRYRKRKLNSATPTWVDRNALRALEKERVELERRTGIKFEIDHIIPIKNPLFCGLHVPWNLQIVTANYNNSKGNRVSEKFLQECGLGVFYEVTISSGFLDSNADLVTLWDEERNYPLKPNAIHLSCPIVVWWKCKKSHSWSKSLREMQRNHTCPVCTGKAEIGFSNDFISPDIAAEWDYKKNTPWTPENFRRHSNKKVFWICVHNHSYPKSITARSTGVGCPECQKLGLRTRETTITKDKTQYDFEHYHHKFYSGTIVEFEKKYALNRSEIVKLVRGKKLSYQGWFIRGNNPRLKIKIFSFFHSIHGEFNGTIPDLCMKFQLNSNSLYRITNATYSDYSHKGWVLKGVKKKVKIIKLVHPEHGLFQGRAIDLVNLFSDLTPVGVSNVANGKTLSHKGWSLK